MYYVEHENPTFVSSMFFSVEKKCVFLSWQQMWKENTEVNCEKLFVKSHVSVVMKTK